MPTHTFTRRRLFARTAASAAALAFMHPMLARSAPAKGGGKGKKRRKAIELAVGKHPGTSEDKDIDFSAEEIALGNLLAAKARHAFTVAAADPDKGFAKGGLADVSAAFVKRMPAAKAKRAKTEGAALLAAPEATRKAKFATYAALAPTIHTKPPKDAELEKAAEKVIKKNKGKKNAQEKAEPTFERFEFHLNSLHCLSQTDDSVFDPSNEILIGGHVVTPKGKLVKLKTVQRDGVEDGEWRMFDDSACAELAKAGIDPADLPGEMCEDFNEKNPYKGHRMFHVDLPKGEYPRTWTIVFVLGEEDWGGFGKYLGEVYSALEDEIRKALDGLVDLAGDTFGIYGTAIASAVAWALGGLVDLISEWMNDELLGIHHYMVQLKGRERSRFADKKGLPAPKSVYASTMKKLRFNEKDGDGLFDIRFHWRLVA